MPQSHYRLADGPAERFSGMLEAGDIPHAVDGNEITVTGTPEQLMAARALHSIVFSIYKNARSLTRGPIGW